jgi:hypothetical protein
MEMKFREAMETANLEKTLDVEPLHCDRSQWLQQETVGKRRVLLITTRSLFGSGIRTLLAQRGDHVTVEVVPTLRSALQRERAVAPDVVAYFTEKPALEERALLRELGARYGARVIYGTLDADRLTINDQTHINHATVDDLIAAVLNTNGHQGGRL